MTPGVSPGTLYVVATPIGNLEDITYRAVRVLAEVDCIACEDTRHSRKLLEHYDIRRPTVSYYRENEAARGAELVARLQAGESIALITDAGTPMLSDPGQRLVERALAAGIRVVPLPGPSAALAGLMASGMGEPVAIAGFLPPRSGERRRRLEQLAPWPGALVLFESPHRLAASLADIEEILGGARPLHLARELTKVHEEILHGTVADLRARLAGREPRGEFTLVLGPAPAAAPASSRPAPVAASRAELKRLARESGLSRSELYRRLQQLRGRMEEP